MEAYIHRSRGYPAGILAGSSTFRLTVCVVRRSEKGGGVRHSLRIETVDKKEEYRRVK
jgi:hypothetical protein